MAIIDTKTPGIVGRVCGVYEKGGWLIASTHSGLTLGGIPKRHAKDTYACTDVSTQVNNNAQAQIRCKMLTRSKQRGRCGHSVTDLFPAQVTRFGHVPYEQGYASKKALGMVSARV